MKEATLPANEQDRLEALAEYCILDTLPEQSYDDVTAIAAQICGTPIALVSLVDADRQWFKSHLGLDAQETPRVHAFCAHAIVEPTSMFVVEDTTKDQRFADNPLVVSAPHLRFYAGAPLVTSGGHALGTLCVIDRKPRSLTDAQRDALQALSRQVIALLELRKTLNDVRTKSEKLERSKNELQDLCQVLESQADVMERDMRHAETIQRSLLPHEAPEIDNFCVHSLYLPGRSIGGDLFDIIGIADRYVAVMIADAAGHGVSAALLSLLFKQRLQLVDANKPRSPAQALSAINRLFSGNVPAPGAFVTATVCVLDLHDNALRIASAGHTPTIVLRADGTYEQIASTGPALGLYHDASFTERTVTLSDRDQLFLFTDGLFDLNREVPPKVGDVVSQLRSLPPNRDLQSLISAFSGGVEAEDRDDVTMLLIEAAPGQSHFFEPVHQQNVGAGSLATLSQIEYADTPAGAYLALSGRVTWTQADSVLDCACAVLETKRRLMVDLSRCEYLDSTLLGTLYEIVKRAIGAATQLSLHGVSPTLRSAFLELSMHSVIEHIDDTELQPPTNTRPIQRPTLDVRRQKLRLLRAHEVLVELSEDNKREFADVVHALRAEVRESHE